MSGTESVLRLGPSAFRERTGVDLMRAEVDRQQADARGRPAEGAALMLSRPTPHPWIRR